MMQHTAFFGDGEKSFALTASAIDELERKTGHGVGAIFKRVREHQFTRQEIAETIRLSLVGGGTSPSEADALVRVYVEERPLTDSFDLAFAILAVRFFGNGTSA